MQIIEHEIKKYDLWKEELNRKKKSIETAGSDKAAHKKDYEKTKKKFDGLVKKQDQLLRGISQLNINTLTLLISRVQDPSRIETVLGVAFSV